MKIINEIPSHNNTVTTKNFKSILIEKYSIVQLKKMCKARRIKGYSNKRKKVLIKLLKNFS
jgi:hypothetical protein